MLAVTDPVRRLFQQLKEVHRGRDRGTPCLVVNLKRLLRACCLADPQAQAPVREHIVETLKRRWVPRRGQDVPDRLAGGDERLPGYWCGGRGEPRGGQPGACPFQGRQLVYERASCHPLGVEQVKGKWLAGQRPRIGILNGYHALILTRLRLLTS